MAEILKRPTTHQSSMLNHTTPNIIDQINTHYATDTKPSTKYHAHSPRMANKLDPYLMDKIVSYYKQNNTSKDNVIISHNAQSPRVKEKWFESPTNKSITHLL